MLRPPIFPFLIGALSLIAAHAPAQQGDIGGWRGPIWEQSEIDITDIDLADMNQDGYPDVVVHGRSNSEPLVSVYDGLTGRRFFQYPLQPVYHYGQSALGDIDGDGVADLVLSETEFEVRGMPFAGRIVAIQGGSGQVLWEVRGTEANLWLGQTLELKDLDGDGDLELFTQTQATVIAFDAQNGQEIWRKNGTRDDRTWGWIDLDHDGIDELLITGPRVAVLDSQTGSTRLSFDLRAQSSTPRIIGFDDFNGDQVLDILLQLSVSQFEFLAVDGRSGQLIWRNKESWKNQVRTMLSFDDFSGDGVSDLLLRLDEDRLGSPQGGLVLLDGVTGRRLWTQFGGAGQTVFQGEPADLNGDGVPEILATSVNSVESWKLIALSGRTGDVLWEFKPPESFSIHRADFDADGRDEIVLASPGAWESSSLIRNGWIGRIDSTSGAQVWERWGIGSNDLLGAVVSTADHDADGRADLLITAGSWNQTERALRLDPFTGALVWETLLEDRVDADEKFFVQDLDGRPGDELILMGDTLTSGSHAVKVVTGDGEYLWSIGKLHRGGRIQGSDFTVLPDRDFDGSPEVLLIRRLGVDQTITLLSGARGNQQPGIHAKDEFVSQATGGAVAVDLHFPPEQAGNPYQLLLSFAGTGPIVVNGLEIPLGMDGMLIESAQGNYPLHYFRGAQGVLDQYSRGRMRFVALPGRLGAGIVGRTMHFAAISGPVSGTWDFSSKSLPITFIP